MQYISLSPLQAVILLGVDQTFICNKALHQTTQPALKGIKLLNIEVPLLTSL